MNQRSRSTLFLIEQLIVVAVFAICSAACVRILSSAYLNARYTKDVTNAVLIAKSGAESFKAFAGDIGKTAEVLGGAANNTGGGSEAIVYYDKHWNVCGKDNASYIFHLIAGKPTGSVPSLLSGEVLVERLTGESLVSFTVAVRERGAWE